MPKHFLSRQFLKYILVGFLGTALDFLLLYSLVKYLHLFYLLAAFISIAIVLWISFTLNKYWTFKDGGKKYLRQFIKFVLAHAFGNGLNLLILFFLVQGFGLWYIYAKIFATAVSAILNFFIVKKWVFIQKTEDEEKIKKINAGKVIIEGKEPGLKELTKEIFKKGNLLTSTDPKIYKNLGYKDDTPVAKKMSKQVLSLPVHPGLKQKDLDYIIKNITIN